MAFRSFESVLDECIMAVRRGVPVEDCLARFPRHARRLAPYLQLTEKIVRTPSAQPRSEARDAAWAQVSARAEELRTGRRRMRRAATRERRGFNWGLWLRPVAVVLALFFVLAMTGGATAIAAQDALPDDRLYAVKLATEDVRLWFVFDEQKEAEILLDQSNERIAEITAMVASDKPVPANVLSTLENRNTRAAAIITRDPNSPLLGQMIMQYEGQERILVELWDHVDESARDEYTSVVAVIHNTQLQGAGDAFVAVQPEDLAGGVRKISGPAQPLGDGRWSINGIEVTVDERTLGSRNLQSGATARFVIARSASGRYHALTASTIGLDGPPSSGHVVGEVEQVDDDGIWIAGNFYPMTQSTIALLNLKEGDRVDVTVGTSDQGAVVDVVRPAATPSVPQQANKLSIEGTLGSSDLTSDFWTIGGIEVEIPQSVNIDARAAPLQEGARLLAEITIVSGVPQARSITVLASAAAPSSVYIVGTYQGLEAGSWKISGLSLLPPGGSIEPVAGTLVAVYATAGFEGIAVDRFTLLQGTADPPLARIQGTILGMEDSRTRWTMEAAKVRVRGTVQVDGEPLVGVRALVWGRSSPDGTIEATYVRILDDQPLVITTAAPTTPAP